MTRSGAKRRPILAVTWLTALERVGGCHRPRSRPGGCQSGVRELVFYARCSTALFHAATARNRHFKAMPISGKPLYSRQPLRRGRPKAALDTSLMVALSLSATSFAFSKLVAQP